MKHVIILRHVPHESPGSLATILRACDVPVEIVDCFDTSWPAVERAGLQLKRVAGLVVMGGPMNVDETDRFGFLATEVEWLAQAAAAELPTMGICLGAQLLAKALGAKVYRHRVREIGWYDVELLPAAGDDALFGGSGPQQTVFQWHGDTFDLPAGAVQLARGTTCEQQAFRYAQAYGLQFHLEMTAEMVDDWLAEPGMCGELQSTPDVDPTEIRRHTPGRLAEMAPLAQRVLGRFAAMCKAQMDHT